LKIVHVLLLLALVSACQAADVNDVEKSIRDVKAKYESQLMAMAGVVSVGLGQDAEGNPVIVIGIESEEFSNTLALPRELENYPVKFEVMGTIKAQ
jgi:hypothetical protein